MILVGRRPTDAGCVCVWVGGTNIRLIDAQMKGVIRKGRVVIRKNLLDLGL